MIRRGLGLAALGLLTACSPGPRWVAVAGDGAATILLYSADLSRADTISLQSALDTGETVRDVAFAPDGASLWVTVASDSDAALLRVRREDGRTPERIPLGGIPTVVSVLSDARAVLAAVVPAGEAGGEPRGVLHFIPTAGPGDPLPLVVCDGEVRDIVLLGALGRLYAICDGDAVAEVDVELRRTIRTVPLPVPAGTAACGAGAGGRSANGTVIFVLCEATGQLLYLDRVRLSPLDSVELGAGVRGLAQTPDWTEALVVRETEAGLLFVDLGRREVRAEVQAPHPTVPTVSSDGRWAYGVGAGVLFRLDVGSAVVETRVEAPEWARRVALWPGYRSPVMRWR